MVVQSSNHVTKVLEVGKSGSDARLADFFEVHTHAPRNPTGKLGVRRSGVLGVALRNELANVGFDGEPTAVDPRAVVAAKCMLVFQIHVERDAVTLQCCIAVVSS